MEICGETFCERRAFPPRLFLKKFLRHTFRRGFVKSVYQERIYDSLAVAFLFFKGGFFYLPRFILNCDFIFLTDV